MLDKIKKKRAEKYERQRTEYLSQYKPSGERDLHEKVIIDCLFHIEFKGAIQNEKARRLGAIEGVLVTEGEIDPTNSLRSLMFPNEDYEKLMIRLGKSYLSEKNK